MTVALVGGDGGVIRAEALADQVICAYSRDPQVVKEVHVTAYHLLWELVHVFLERDGALSASLSATTGPGR
jgi:D-sedoheptulose 7-phosphate isomerase